MECVGFIQCAQAGSASQFHDASSVEGALRTQGAIMHSRIRIVGGICFRIVRFDRLADRSSQLIRQLRADMPVAAVISSAVVSKPHPTEARVESMRRPRRALPAARLTQSNNVKLA
jgi:hypothetical protein